MTEAVLSVRQDGNKISIEPIEQKRPYLLSEQIVADGQPYKKAVGPKQKGTVTAGWAKDNQSLWLQVVAGTADEPVGAQRAVWRLEDGGKTWIRQTSSIQPNGTKETLLRFPEERSEEKVVALSVWVLVPGDRQHLCVVGIQLQRSRPRRAGGGDVPAGRSLSRGRRRPRHRPARAPTPDGTRRPPLRGPPERPARRRLPAGGRHRPRPVRPRGEARRSRPPAGRTPRELLPAISCRGAFSDSWRGRAVGGTPRRPVRSRPGDEQPRERAPGRL